MAMLHLNVLGNPALFDNGGHALEYHNKKAFGLLVYLAMHPGQAFDRDELVHLFWPESETPQARQNLRQALLELRKEFATLDPLHLSTTQTLELPPAIVAIDALTFIQLLQTSDVTALNQAMEIYRGDFMQGFTLQVPGFDQWVLEQRQRIQQIRQLSLQTQATLELHSNSRLGDTQQIITACLQAAHREMQQQQYQSALRFLDRAQGLSDDPHTHLVIALQRGDTLLESNSPLPAVAAFELAYKLAMDSVQQARASIGMARGLITRRQYAAASQLLDRALLTLVDTDHYTVLAQLHYCRGLLQHHSHRSEQALLEYRLAVKFAELAENSLWLCRTVYQLAAGSLQFTHFTAALTYSERCLRLAHTHHLEQFEIPCLILRGQALLSQNRLHDSFLELEYALSLAKRDAYTQQQCLVQMHLAELSLWQESNGTALAYCEKALEDGAGNAESMVTQAIQVLAEHYMHSVNDDDDRIDKAYMQSLDHADPACSAIILAILSRITADPQRCQWALQEAERLLTGLPATLDQLRFYQHAIEAAINHEQWARAHHFAHRLENALANEPAPFYNMFANRARLLATIGEGNDNAAIVADLVQLRKQAYDLNLLALLPAYDKAQQLFNPTMDCIT